MHIQRYRYIYIYTPYWLLPIGYLLLMWRQLPSCHGNLIFRKRTTGAHQAFMQPNINSIARAIQLIYDTQLYNLFNIYIYTKISRSTY